jgi:hypothetical protein
VEHVKRRRSPRVRVGSHAQLPASLRDVGLGGFSLETPTPLPRGSVHDFGLAMKDGSAVVLRARVVHSHRELRPMGGHVYVTGVKFLEDVTGRTDLFEHPVAS